MVELLSWVLPEEESNSGCILLLRGEVSADQVAETRMVFREGCGYLEGGGFSVYLPREVLLWLVNKTAIVSVCASVLSGGVAGFCGRLSFERDDYLKMMGAYEYQ